MSEESLVGEQPNNENAASESETLIGSAVVEQSETPTEEPQKEVEQKELEAKPEETEIIYEDFKVPEGVVLNPEITDEFKGFAKELKLNQEQAQKLVDFQTKISQGYTAQVESTFKQTVNSWKEESIRELGPNYKQELGKVAKVMDHFGSPELRELLNNTGLGNHKEVVKLFLNVAGRISEDNMRGNLSVNRLEKSLAERHYPKSNMQ